MPKSQVSVQGPRSSLGWCVMMSREVNYNLPLPDTELLVRPNLIVVLWYNGSRLAILLSGIEVSEAQAITKLKEEEWGFHLVVTCWDLDAVE